MSEVEQAARSLLAGDPSGGESSTQLAERAVQATERLTEHLARLLGEIGVRMLLERSIVVASARFPWLRSPTVAGEPPETPSSALRHAMEQQEPAAVTDAFVEVLVTFVDLLKRLVGDGLVERLLNEVWPAVFAPAAKETP